MTDNKKSMFSFVTRATKTTETKTVTNFLPNEYVDKTIKLYDSLTENLSQLTNKKVRIPEFTFHPEYPPEVTEYITFDSDPKNSCGLGEYIDLDEDNLIYNDFVNSVDTDVLKGISEVLTNNLKTSGFDNFDIIKISIQNINEFNHVTQSNGNMIIDRNKGRDNFPLTSPAQWTPKKILEKPLKNIPAFQGTIALDLDNEKYSTAIFNQWFPWSTYYMPNYTEETTPWKKRSRISFLKEDEPIRFNESIRNYTSAEFSDSDWNTINENWITSCDWHKFDRQQFYGLSLENVLAYGKPGTLNLWDRRKYTLAMPWNAEFKTRRLTLNFETKNT